MTPPLFGHSRSVRRPDHALICPDSFVRSPLPGWEKTTGVVLISPRMGAGFCQYMAYLEPGGVGVAALPGVERLAYAVEGDVILKIGKLPSMTISAGGFAYLPANTPAVLRAGTQVTLCVFEKRYVSLPDVPMPEPVVGKEQALEGVPFQGDPDAVLKVLLPTTPSFDMAVNVFSYKPGGCLPQVEMHVMEHGLLMLDGAGVYKLNDAWYPVQKGDVIWMGPYCPQWFVAMGKSPARYLYYKDVHRDPME